MGEFYVAVTHGFFSGVGGVWNWHPRAGQKKTFRCRMLGHIFWGVVNPKQNNEVFFSLGILRSLKSYLSSCNMWLNKQMPPLSCHWFYIWMNYVKLISHKVGFWINIWWTPLLNCQLCGWHFTYIHTLWYIKWWISYSFQPVKNYLVPCRNVVTGGFELQQQNERHEKFGNKVRCAIIRQMWASKPCTLF